MLLPALLFLAQASNLKTAASHPIQYYVSLPKGWSKKKTWPVVVGIESADREFAGYFRALSKARGEKPFIIVVPLVVTNGGSRYRQGPGYRYSEATWSQIEADTWAFDNEGLQAVIKETTRLYNGASKVYLTGFEAGGHTVFAFTLAHPNLIRAAAPVAPNYAGRNIQFSGAGPKPAIRCFVGGSDEMWSRFGGQWETAKADASAHGFTKLSEQHVPGKGHVALADEVIDWFAKQP